VELWFATGEGKVYLSHEGEETDWMKNLKQNGEVSFEIGGEKFTGKSHYVKTQMRQGGAKLHFTRSTTARLRRRLSTIGSPYRSS